MWTFLVQSLRKTSSSLPAGGNGEGLRLSQGHFDGLLGDGDWHLIRESVTTATRAVVNITVWSWAEVCCGRCYPCRPLCLWGGRAMLTPHRLRRSSGGAILVDNTPLDDFYEPSLALSKANTRWLMIWHAHSCIQIWWICTWELQVLIHVEWSFWLHSHSALILAITSARTWFSSEYHPLHWERGPLETSENMLGTLRAVDQCTYYVSAKNISSTFEM